MNVRSYRDLVVWQKAMDLVVLCYRESQAFPAEERYGLTSQLRRAAVSVPANIAEGRSRHGTGDFGRFLSISYGSLAELETLLLLSERLGYMPSKTRNDLMRRTREIGRMLNGLRASIQRGGRSPRASGEPLAVLTPDP